MSAAPINQPHPTHRRQSLRKALAALFATAIAAFGTLSASSPATATAFAPTSGSPAEFTLDLDNRGLPFLIGSYNTALGYQNYQIMNIEGTTTSDADAGYPGHDLVRDFQGDPSDWWFAPGGWTDQGRDLHGFMYDAAAPAGSKYAYFVLELTSEPSYIGRVDNNGIFSYVAQFDRPSGLNDRAEHEWTMLSNGDVILFDSPTGKLLNFGNLRSLTDDYTYDTKQQSPSLTPLSETAAGQEMSATTFSDTGDPGLLQTAIVDIAGVEHVMVFDSDSLPSVGIHLFNAATLAYVGELDPSASTGLEGEAAFWTTTSSPQVEATASIGGDAYLVYSTPDTVPSFSPMFGSYAMGKIAGGQIDLNTMTVTITSHLTDVEMRNRVSLGIQAPAASQTLNLPPALPAISYLVYDENGGQTGTSPDTHTDTTSTDVTVESGIPTYDGYHFTGWNSAADGTGASYDAGDNYTLPAAAGAADYVYAQWAQAASSSPLSCSAWAGLIWVQNQYGTSTNDYQAADTGQFFLLDPATGSLDADGLDDASTWVYQDAVLGYDLSINATGIDPMSNIMYGTAKVGDNQYVASFAPGEDPVFYSKNRVRVDGSIITNIGNGSVDAEGHYWIKDSQGPLYRSQNPLPSYAGFANHTDVTDPMVFDAIGSGDFGNVSDIAVIPTADGYLAASLAWNTLHWGTWDSTTDTWTSGTNASVATGTASPGDYGAVFVDGVTSDGGTLDYSGASIYFTPNAGWDPETSSGRRPVKLAVADALDGITSDDLVLLESTPSPVTGANDGAAMAGCGLQLPDPLGGLHGWVWQDADDNGTRDTVEPTNGLFGSEGVVTNYTATVISETDWTTLQGVVVLPAGTRFPATVDGDGKWTVEGLASGTDPMGVQQTFQVEFDITNADGWLDGFVPNGFVEANADSVTTAGGASAMDSDVISSTGMGTVGLSAGGITVTPSVSTHAADAGIADTPEPPAGELDATWYLQCSASNDGSADIWFTELSNSYSTDATFKLFFGDTLIATQVVAADSTMAGVFWEYVLPYQSLIRVDGTVDGSAETVSSSSNGCETVGLIIYEEEGGNEVEDDTCMYGTGDFTIPAAPTREGYTFAGWNSAADGSGTNYVIGQTYDCDDLVIYALWTQDPVDEVEGVAVEAPLVSFTG